MRGELRGIAVVAALGCHGHAAVAIDATADSPRADADAAGDAGDAAVGSACPAGTSLVVDRTSCAGSAAAPPSSLTTGTPQSGDVVSLDGVDVASLPCMPLFVCRPDGAATMMFSDDPESVSDAGVLYADTFGPGRARLYVYHVNAGASARKFPVVALNQGSADAHVTIVQRGSADPTTDYIDAGKTAAAAWLASSEATVVTVPAGQRVLLDAALDAEHAATNELVHAIFDVEVDAPVKLSIVSVLASEDAAAVTASLPLLPNDGQHDRGTFPGADLVLVGSAGGGPSLRSVELGDGVTEAELPGVDATTGSAATLHGNYGVRYTFATTAVGELRWAASPRGGDWAGAIAGSAVAPLPTAAGGLGTTTQAVWLATAVTGFVMITAGASSLPLDVLVITP